MKKKTIGIILIFILVIMLGIGITYAYFSAIIIGKENASTLVLEAGELEINVDGGNIITASKFLPDSNVPFAIKTITLTGKNTSIYLNMPYTIKLVVDNNTFTSGSIKYSISGVNNSSSGKVIPDMEMKDACSTITIGSGYFERGNPLIHTYTLKVYFPETGTDQSENMKAVYSAHIEVTGEEAEEPAPKGWWKAESGTLLAAIRDNSTLHVDETGMTVPGQDIATTDEQLRITTDDYGVSFYYRGAVENNYVVFANKCWRIVRVTGDGSIKLVLHNNDAAECDISDNTLNFAKYDGGHYKQAFNGKDEYYYNNNISYYIWSNTNGVGFMYGNPNATNYLDAQANIHDSTILKSLKEWYDLEGTFTSKEKESLADVIWCNDKSLNPAYGGYGQNETYYSARTRINISPNPTLICPNINENKNLSKNTAADILYGNGKLNGYKIGLLTADEVAYAGGAFKMNNNKYYLNTNVTFWTMSPYYYNINTNIVHNFYVGTNGLEYGSVNGTYGLRPSIALIPTSQATYNTSSEYAPGTVNNPYVIEVN